MHSLQCAGWIGQQIAWGKKPQCREVTMEKLSKRLRNTSPPPIDVKASSDSDLGGFGGWWKQNSTQLLYAWHRHVKTLAISSQSGVKNTRWILPPPSCDNKHPQPRIWLHLSLHPHACRLPNVLSSIGVQLQPLLHDRKKRKWKKQDSTALDSNFRPPHPATCILGLKVCYGTKHF